MVNAAPQTNISIGGVLTAKHYGDVAAEVRALRTGVALSDMNYINVIRIDGPGAFDAVNWLCPLELFVRDGQVRQTLLLREDGTPLADVHLACDDEAWLLFCEGASHEALMDHIKTVVKAFDCRVMDLSETHHLLSLNGPFAWQLMAKLEGDDVIAFPYLSFYQPAPNRLYVRAGKTGEFGYDLLIPKQQRQELEEQIVSEGKTLALRRAGTDALWQCALENWFFNIHREGAHGLSPVELGLQWRISYNKPFLGEAAIQLRRSESKTRLIPIRSATEVTAGDSVFFDEQPIGTLLLAEPSHTLAGHIGAALLDVDYAFSGIGDFCAGPTISDAQAIRTVSAPMVNNLSLYVDPQQHRYEEREQIAYPGSDRATPT